MAQWQQIQMLDHPHREQVLRLYAEDYLPMEVRQYLAYWIEEQNWSHVVQSDSSQACWLFQTMLALLDEQLGHLMWHAENNSDMVLKHNLRRSKLSLQERYGDNPEKLANIIDGLLREEKAILSAAMAASPTVVDPPPDVVVITGHETNIEDRLAEMRKAIQRLKNSIEQLEELQETFTFRFNTYKILGSTMPSDPSLPTKWKNLQDLINNLDCFHKDVLAQIQAVLGRSDTLRDLLLLELSMWQTRQQRACIGDVCDTSLQQLEKWCTGSAEELFHLRWLLQTLDELRQKITYDTDPLPLQLPQLKQRLQEQICCLLKSAFVVESQPKMPFPNRRPLLLKTCNRFSVGVRLLVKLMDQEHKMEVKMEIDSDAANSAGFRRFNILIPSTKTMVKDRPQMEGLVCNFSHIMLKEVKSCGSGKGKGGKGASEGSLPVTEELHVITFTLDYCYRGLKCKLQTSTLPVVVITNVNQASTAWASILWFNMLSADPKNQQFFSKPPVATWAKLSEVLSWQFSDATKRGLDVEQLKMLGEKLCGLTVTAQSTVTWAQFCKETCPPGEKFSFWIWLDGILGLIREHLLEMWKNNLIMGFVSRKRERHLLKKKQVGTFLLRFSETTRDGGITCTWVEYDNNGSPVTRSVEPYTKAELKDLALPDIIRDYQIFGGENLRENPLRFLYPGTPRNEAFSPYYSERREGDLMVRNKYISRRLIRVSTHPDEPRALEENLQEPHVLEGNPQEPRVLEGNPQEPRILEGNPTQPHVLEGNPTKPYILEGNPQEPHVLEGNPTEPHILEGNPQEPCVLEGNPQEPHVLEGNPLLPCVNDTFPTDPMDMVNNLFVNMLKDDPFLPSPSEEEQQEYHELFALLEDVKELDVDEADF